MSLGGHLLDEQRRPVKRCFFADALPRDVAPGEAVEFAAKVHLPDRLGRYVLRPRPVRREGGLVRAVRLAHRRRRGFASKAGRTAALRTGSGARLELLAPAPPARVARRDARGRPHPRDEHRRHALAHGDARGAGRGHAWACSCGTSAGALLSARLPEGAAPAARAIPARRSRSTRWSPRPPESGRFRLVFDLVAEQICWFEHHGSPGLADRPRDDLIRIARPEATGPG